MDGEATRKKEGRTYNTRDSLVVTHPTTSLALIGLSMGERTGSRVFQWVWSYVPGVVFVGNYIATTTRPGETVVVIRRTEKQVAFCDSG